MATSPTPDRESARQRGDEPRRTRVLYIEDEVALRPLIVAAFDTLRFEVLVAAGPAAALFLTQRDVFDVIVCGTPETLRALVENWHGLPSPVLLVADGAETEGHLVSRVPRATAPASLRELATRVAHVGTTGVPLAVQV